jgi:mRNA interferase MazF
VARVTTQLYGTRYDVTVADWQISGLLAPSVVRLHKLATLNQSLFGRVLGHVSATDRRRIGAVMRSIYGRW